MIATGTDVKPIEVLIFLRDVRSELYFEQMKGRGVRTISNTDLQAVTPDADAKTRFVLIDAVGVTESAKTISAPLNRDHTIAFDKLLEQVAAGDRRDDTISTLAARLAMLDRKLDPDSASELSQLAGGKTLADLARGLLDFDRSRFHCSCCASQTRRGGDAGTSGRGAKRTEATRMRAVQLRQRCVKA